MFEQLKNIAIQKLMTKMASNALGSSETSEAATEGAGAIMDSIKSKIGGGKIDEVKALFSGENMESNGIFQEAKSKMSEILQSKGMSAEEATAEAESATPDLIAGLKEKFESSDSADAGFDLGALTNLIPGNAGDLLNKAKNLF